ncbi:conserved hypothetical protein [Latilactobacillus sakei]|nr:conserved hypothetical protein [Latilactobacillus sakei]
MIAVSNCLTFKVNRKDMTYGTRLDDYRSNIKKGSWDKFIFVPASFLWLIFTR